MFTKKTCIALALIVCLIVATPISVFSGSGDDIVQIEQTEDSLIESSGTGDMTTTDVIEEPGYNTNEPNGNSEVPSGGVDEPTGGTDEPNSGTDEPNGGSIHTPDESEELDSDIDESDDTDNTDESDELDEPLEIDELDDTDFDSDYELKDEADIVNIVPPQETLLNLLRTDLPIRVETRQELLNVFNTGAISDGDFNWSGTRIVEIAFDNVGAVVTPNTPGLSRTVILRSADGVQRNIAVNYDNRHFNIGNGITLVIDDDNLHFVGRASENRNGGGINVSNGATLRMNGGVIKNCRAANGGGVNVTGGSALFEMNSGIIEGNIATDGGGGVHLDVSATFNMNGGILRANRIPVAGTSGAAVRVRDNSLFNMQSGVIENNEVLHTGQFAYGGAVCVGEVNQDTNISTFNMNGGVIRSNKAQWGGGVAAYNGFFNLGTGRTERGPAPDSQGGDVYGPVISGNEARGNEGWSTNAQIGHGGGGGVWVYDVFGATYSFVMHSGSITGNETRYRGGGVFVNRADCVLRGGDISNNYTTDNANANSGGGGVYLHTNDTRYLPTLDVKNAVISGNSSRIGGGIARNSNAPIEISENSVISGNTAQLDGGGIHTGITDSGANITSATVGTGRGNLYTGSNVVFEGNQSQQATSYGLTVTQVSLNSDLFNRVSWSGKNSARGSLANMNSYHLFNNHDINNLQGNIVRDLGALTISKTVGGDLGNLLMSFEFTVMFIDSDGKPLAGMQLAYIGDTLPDLGATAPADGVLSLDNNGSATFSLGHGQVITIQDIPLGGFVQVIETPYEGYETSFITSDYSDTGALSNDSTMLPFTGDRTLNFTNIRNMVSPPTGIASDDIGRIILLVVVVGLTGLTVLVVNKYPFGCSSDAFYLVKYTHINQLAKNQWKEAKQNESKSSVQVICREYRWHS